MFRCGACRLLAPKNTSRLASFSPSAPASRGRLRRYSFNCQKSILCSSDGGFSTATRTQRRGFFGRLFGGDSNKAKTQQQQSNASAEVARARKESAKVKERVVDAGMQLLSFFRDHPKAAAIDNILQLIFVEPPQPTQDVDDSSSSSSSSALPRSHPQLELCEQYDVIVAALCCEEGLGNRDLQRSILVVSEALLPPLVHDAHVAIDVSHMPPQQRDLFVCFIHKILGAGAGGGVSGADVDGESKKEERSFSDFFREFDEVAPHLFNEPAFQELLVNAERLSLQSQLAALLGKMCAAFDPKGTGMLPMGDLRGSLVALLGEAEADRMLADCPTTTAASSSGVGGGGGQPEAMISYGDVIRLIMRR